MMKKLMLTLLTAALVMPLLVFGSEGTAHATGSVTVYPTPANLPAAYKSADFTVTAQGSQVAAYNAGSNSWGNNVSYGSFEMTGSVSVSITPNFNYSSYRLVPRSLGLNVTRSGNTITFTLNEPSHVTLILDDNYQGKVLHLFADGPDTNIPSENDPNVIYYGPGYHDLTGSGASPIMLDSNKTLYIAPGAIVRGRVRAYNASNVTIRGRGILLNDTTPNDAHGNITLALNFVNQATIKDVIVNNNTANWTSAVHGSEFVNVTNYKGVSPKFASSDGFDINSSHDITFNGSFIRSADDSIAIKGLSDETEPALALPIYNIAFFDTQLWSDANNAIGIGAETVASYVKNIHFQNIDILYNFDDRNHPDVLPDRSAINIFALEATHFSDITFEDIRVEKAKRLINVQMDTSFYFGALHGNWSWPGEMKNITYKNITSYSDGTNEIKLAGWDNQHQISNVMFDNININGTVVQDFNDPHFNMNSYVNRIEVKAPGGLAAKSRLQAAEDYATVQGNQGWRYRVLPGGGTAADMSWNPDSSNHWRGMSTFDAIWSDNGNFYLHPDNNNQVALEWQAARPGTVRLTGVASKLVATGGDGVKVSIWKNGTMIWPADGQWQTIAYNDTAGVSHQVSTTVAAGDKISFRVDQNGNSSYDSTSWNPEINYEFNNVFNAAWDMGHLQGNHGWYYRVWRSGIGTTNMNWNPDGSNHWRGPGAFDAIWNGSGNMYLHPDNSQAMLEWQAPKAGTVRVKGQVRKADTTGGDGVNVSIWKNGTMVWPADGQWQTIAAQDGTGVAHDFTLQLTQDDTLSFRVDQRANSGYDSTAWNPVIRY
ncbi:glycosyl hydrolase family 28 protein [Paenibacillus sp. J5C_2022]|uniref:glycosyl hydrolase family 28 protein n=1 Tax=Paenibacillus sp. J5C2022 TaxID=2977129 RepID=UPI0021D3A39F|nr:glycosyl hydrolase family 28 protein [Paenibacillus sp. J5C2022]MCU6707356.1 glycosyl hydrolase family 28 protein [Paenibacillus sp. J5C2022]